MQVAGGETPLPVSPEPTMVRASRSGGGGVVVVRSVLADPGFSAVVEIDRWLKAHDAQLVATTTINDDSMMFGIADVDFWTIPGHAARCVSDRVA